MSIDSLRLARAYLDIRSASQAKEIHDSYISHEVMPNETSDPSLSNRLVYGNRADWYASSAINGLFDVDAPTTTGNVAYLSDSELQSIANPNKNTGMNLYG